MHELPKLPEGVSLKMDRHGAFKLGPEQQRCKKRRDNERRRQQLQQAKQSEAQRVQGLLASGKSHQEIAGMLYMSVTTVYRRSREMSNG